MTSHVKKPSVFWLDARSGAIAVSDVDTLMFTIGSKFMLIDEPAKERHWGLTNSLR
jgi:hypothetical protein